MIAFAIVLPAAASAQAQTRVALVVGNSRYANVAALANPENDAKEIGRSFERLGFSVTQLLDANFDGLRKALLQFNRTAMGADIAVIYFAGHGMEVNDENWLLPVDAIVRSESDIDKEAVGLRTVMLAVSNTTRLGLVILDACRNNPFAARMLRASRSRAVQHGLARVEPRKNILVAYAARDGTTSEDGIGSHSPFTAALLNNLETPGLEINFLFRRVRDEVAAATGGAQQPFVYGSLSKEKIYLKPPKGPLIEAATISPEALSPGSVATSPSPIETSSGPVPTADHSQLVTECDRLAASPLDDLRPAGVAGVRLSDIKIEVASLACEAAQREHPTIIRFEFESGRVAQADKNYGSARRLYEAAASAGYASAMDYLGLLWAGGHLGAPDYGLARYWFEKAVALGNVAAMSDLGFVYETGKGVAPDYGIARQLYQKAAAAGDSTGMNNLGALYEFGRDVPHDVSKARQWYEKSAALGNPLGMRNLGRLYAEGKGVTKDLHEARKWYIQAVAKGDVVAKKKLSELNAGH
ncbi:MAG: caspase family protein [Beijerinckiaceae bacterium]